MFAKAFLVALLTVSLSASSLAVPADVYARGGHNNKESEAQCSAATVTVTASAAAATTNVAISTGGNNNASGGKGAAGNNNSGGKGAAGNNKGSGAASSSVAAAASSSAVDVASSSVAAVATASAAATSAAAGAASTSAASTGDIQSSLTLDPSVICSNFAQDGQSPPVTGQVASLTSTNNFINFCSGKTLTNGLQVVAGSCNPAPMGDIPANTKMTSAKFQTPVNFQTFKENTPFTISLAVSNLQLGNFVNANENYFAGPQQLSGGTILGHSHVVVEAIDSFTSTKVSNPQVFAFFKGLNDAGTNGVVSADVTAGLPAGIYKVSSINTAANHQPVLMPVAQHGSTDDVVYFAVTADGAPPAEVASLAGAATATAAASAATAAAATATAAASSVAAITSSAAAKSSSAAAAAATAASGAAAAGSNKLGGFKGGKVGKRRAVF